MDNNISLIPKKDRGSGLPRFVSFEKPELEFSGFAKFFLGLTIVSLLLFGGLYFYKKELNKKISDFEASLQELKKQHDTSLEGRLRSLNSVLGVFKDVLDNHNYWTQFFDLLEKKTLPNVVFDSFNSSDADTRVTFNGRASSYSVLAQQVKILEDTEKVVSVSAKNISLLETGDVGFGLEIVFSKDLIRKKDESKKTNN